MYFEHSSQIWMDFPELVPGVLHAEGITPDASVHEPVAKYSDQARSRLGTSPESELPEIQAWRRTFAKMGLKPTQYRCASESLLRRFRKENSLPSIHPLIDVCNAISLAFAIPIAVFDVSKVSEHLTVRYATGDEAYLTFSEEIEKPERHEVIFADAAGNAHARRWTNRQSGLSAVRPQTSAVLVVAEAMHPTASEDIPRLITAVANELSKAWSAPTKPTVLSAASARFEY